MPARTASATGHMMARLQVGVVVHERSAETVYRRAWEPTDRGSGLAIAPFGLRVISEPTARVAARYPEGDRSNENGWQRTFRIRGEPCSYGR